MFHLTLSPRRRRAVGFTLIELVIVIGIIAVLMGILLPTVGAVRERAKSAGCLSNLRQIGTAAVTYSQRYDNFLVHGYASTKNSGNGSAKADAESYATVMVNAKVIDAPKSISMNAGAASDQQSVFRCPSGIEDLDPQTFGAGDSIQTTFTSRADGLLARALRTKSEQTGVIVDTWYGINASNSAGIKTFYTRYPDGGTQIKRTFDVKDASRTVFLFDGLFMNLYTAPDRINARHNGNRYTNILFADGHAEGVQTRTLPGGMGPNGTSDLFTPAALNAALPTNPGVKAYLWRTDQKL